MLNKSYKKIMAKKKVKLNENDCKNTLSSQKKPKQPKTVLINNVTDYWPALNEQKVTELHEILERYEKDPVMSINHY